MKKLHIRLFALLLIAMPLIFLAACDGEQDSNIAGTYETGGETYTFAEDGGMSVSENGETVYGAYIADGGSMTVIFGNDSAGYHYTTDGKELTISKGFILFATVYEKVGEGEASIDGWNVSLDSGEAVADPSELIDLYLAENETEAETEESEEGSETQAAESSSETAASETSSAETETATKEAETTETTETETTTKETETKETPAETEETAAETKETTAETEETTAETKETESAAEETTSSQGASQSGSSEGSSATASSGFSNPYLYGSVSAGNVVYYGYYEQDNNLSNGSERIEWYVLATDGEYALLLSRYGLDCLPYDSTGSNVTWDSCSLRYWLNSTFLNSAFSAQEQSHILSATVSADYNWEYPSVYAGQTVYDKVFLLSINQAYTYYPSYSSRVCTPTAYAVSRGAVYDSEYGGYWWWLRNPGGYSGRAALIYPYGALDYYGSYVSDPENLIRPAIWVRYR